MTFAVESGSSANGLVVQPDGKLLVAGSATVGVSSPDTPPRRDLLLARFSPDGHLDASFGSGGLLTTTVESNSSAFALLQFLSHLLLARVQPDGRLDVTFGTGGTVTMTVQGSSTGPTLLQQSDGKLVLASMHASVPGTRFAIFDILLARYQVLGCPAIDPDPCLADLETFVTDVYLTALARPPDASEVAYGVDVLATAPSPDTVRGMLHVVFDGPEFRQRPVNPWQYVDVLYQAMLGREPKQVELDWWVQAVLDRFNALLPEFLDSLEFQRVVPSCQDQAAVTLFVGRLYQQVLQQVASPDELAWWTQDIMTWCAIEDAVEFFFNSLEYLSVPRMLANHVMVLYRALLARGPDAGGLAWWVDDLAGQLAAIETDVMSSPEFEAHVYRLFP